MDADLVEFGGELYFAVDFTEGGAPIGLTVRELEALERRPRPYDIARDAIAAALAAASAGSRVDVGRVDMFGEGLTRTAWGGDVALEPDPHGLAGDWLALLPHPAHGDDASDRPDVDANVALEAELLAWLRAQALPFRVPRVVAPVGGVLVREWMAGVPLSLRTGRQPWVTKPWAVVAQVAAPIHALGVPEILGTWRSRREHALAALGTLERLDDAVARDAVAWARDHLPPDEPPSLLHGDLLGQNVLVHLELPPAVIDWERAAGGDPAYDLAIVTRGIRRPFQVDNGLTLLIEAYAAAGGAGVRAEHVRIHELALLAGWVCEERLGGGSGRDALERFRALATHVIMSPSERR